MQQYSLTKSQRLIYNTEKIIGNQATCITTSIFSELLTDENKLEKSVRKVIHSNDIFNIRIVESGEEVQQLKIEPEEIEIEYIYFDEINDFQKYATKYAKEGLDFGNRLYEIRIMVIGNKKGLLFKCHHIIADAWSIALIGNQIFHCYMDEFDEKAVYSYFDYVNDEKMYLSSETYKRDLDYWLKKYQDIGPITHFIEGESTNYEIRRKTLVIEGELASKIIKYSKASNISPYALFMSALEIYIYRVCKSQSFYIGTTNLNRVNRKQKNTAGMFVNTVALNCNIKPDDTFLEVLKQTAIMIWESFKHQRCNYGDVLKELQEKYHFNDRLFDIELNYQNIALDDAHKGDDYEWYPSGAQIIPIQIHVNDVSRENKYYMYFDYQINKFNDEDIEYLFLHLCAILEAGIEDESVKIRMINVLSSQEEQTILHTFNKQLDSIDQSGSNLSTTESYGKTIVELLEEQVTRTPQNIAVAEGNRKITYDTLNRLSNQLARKLRKLGIKPDDTVALLCEESIDLVVGICAIIKSGGAYVPIDITYPLERKLYIINDCMAKVLLVGNMEETQNYNIPIIKLMDKKIYSGDTENLIPVNKLNDLLYVIYTSGTTGKPKGVMMHHHAIVNLIAAESTVMGMDFNTSVSVSTSICFDVATQEIFSTLLAGGTAVIISKEIKGDTSLYVEKILEHNIEILFATPSYFNILISQVNYMIKIGKVLKHIILAGEKFVINEQIAQLDCVRGIKIHNHYGPTESHVVTTSTYDLYGLQNAYSNIGKPIKNCNVYILDDMNLCGIEMPGELCITGVGVARGYLNNKELTNEKFINNPFGQGKMYRTGDLAKWLPDGNLVYLGRMDEQVKIRGYRVELGEVESAIRNTGKVDDVAVVCKTDMSGDNCICAYVVLKSKVDINEIDNSLRDRLPEYMLPSSMMQVEYIPITRNGKLDKKALPDIDITSKEEYVAPRNATEVKLAEIYAEVLRLDKVGIKDNFFTLGGHSLKATKVINEIEVKMGVRFPLQTLFKNPTIEYLAKQFKDIKENLYEPIPMAETNDYYPMSSTQKRLFVIQQIDVQAVTYNMPGAIEVIGDMNYDKMGDIFQTLISRHESLRTSFNMIGGEADQKISDHIKLEIMCREHDTITQQDEELLLSDFVKPFDLSVAPLFRVEIVKISKNRHLIMFDIHHIICDGISLDIIIDEFAALLNGETLCEQHIQYKDYSEWIRRRDLTSQGNYWISRFNDNIPVLSLPYDYHRTNIQSFKGNTVKLDIGKEVREGIEGLAKKLQCTEYMILLTTYMMLLGRYSNQEDIIVGSPISGRVHKDTEHIIGMFANTLPMRGKPEQNKSFLDFLLEMKTVCLEAYENQEYPFDELVEHVNIERDLSRNPIFDVMFSLIDNDEEKVKSKGIGVSLLKVADHISKFDLSLTVSIKEYGYEASCEYCSDLFCEDSIRRILNHYEILLKEIINNVEKKIGDINILTESEKKEILIDFNDTKSAYSNTKTVVDLFEEQVGLVPDKQIVFAKDNLLTYRELNDQANRIASFLIKKGITANECISILLPRRSYFISAIFGILKSRAVYLPISVDFPIERINFIIKDSNSKFVITTKEMISEKKYEGEILLIEDLLQADCCPPVLRPIQSDISYIIYTSGSTGQPKGTMLTHRNLMNFCCNNHDVLKRICSEENPCMVSTTMVAFDMFVTESIFMLVNGVSVVIGDEDEQISQKKLEELIKKMKCTVLQTTPSKMKLFIENQDNCDYLKDLSVIILGGEVFPNDLYETLRKYTKASIFNIYGPSETTVWITLKEIKNPVVNIGKPFSNTQIYIMNQNSLCGIGMIGELCICGDSVGNGYMNLPELNKEKFIDNPYGEGKMYRSGDLAKWLPDGTIEYVGRIDNQIKIRGLRIELSEIEHALLKISDVKNAIVITKQDETGDISICAYMIADNKLDIHHIWEELHNYLPNYMVPSYMLQIEGIPVTRNGKIDRKALPNIQIKNQVNYIAPRDFIEEQMVSIFEQVLEVEHVGIKDNFFELGGNSLKATRLINLVESEFNTRVLLKTFFMDPTVTGLARQIDSTSNDYEPIPKCQVKGCCKMSSAQKRLYVIHQMDGGNKAYNMPVALEIHGDLNCNKVKMAFQTIAERHDVLRTSFHIINEEYIQKIQDEVFIDITEKEIPATTREEKEALLSKFVTTFDLSKAPLLRIEIIKTMDQCYLLMFDMHHIISDGVSLNILIKEFSVLYSGGSLSKPRIQYTDYSEWISRRNLTDQKDYWIKEYSDEVPILSLPLDYQRPKIQSFRGDTISVEISDNTRNKVVDLALQTKSTEYMVLLSVFMILMGRYSRQGDVVVGSPVSGRVHKDTENIIGMFTNTLALRGKPEMKKKYRDFLYEVRESCIKAFENQEYPFEELVEKIDVTRDLSRNPIFDILFAVEEDKEDKIQIKDIDISLMRLRKSIAKFDLSVTVSVKQKGYFISFEYCTDLFKEESIRRLAQHYEVLLSEILSHIDTSIGKLNIITKDEKYKIIKTFNDVHIEYPKDKTVVDLFCKRVEEKPDMQILIAKDAKLTYKEINIQANRIANFLIYRGIEPRDCVSILLPRKSYIMGTLFGILKAGAAYLPISLDFPDERINYIIKDSGSRYIVTTKEIASKQSFSSENVICIDEMLDFEDDSNPVINPMPNDYSYFIYTSGSTGQPKGTILTHKGLMNFCINNVDICERIHKVEEPCLISNTTIAFDMFVPESIFTLVNSIKTVLSDEDEQNDQQALAKLIMKYNCNIIQTTPSKMKMYILDKSECEYLKNINVIILGGEVFSEELYSELRKLTDASIFNIYGPSETTVWMCGREITEPGIDIGKAFGNTQIYILNDNMLCGIGMVGEICICGDCVGEGYLNLPKLNEEKYVKNPFGEGKMYRSGDLGRWLSNGNISYLGRADHQIKIHGLRIEIGEIEAAILRISYIDDVAVIVKEYEGGDKILRAFVVSKQIINAQEMKEILRKYLPAYMVPNNIIQIEKMPSTFNGKKNLKELKQMEITQDEAYIEPMGNIEERIKGIWKDILDVGKVGRYTNFFEIGGHSLNGISLIHKINSTFNVNLSVRTIFTHSTIAALAACVKEQTKVKYNAIPKAENKEYYELSSAQKRLYIMNQLEGINVSYNSSFWLKIEGKFDIDTFKAAYTKMIQRHVAFRTRFELHDEGPVQIIEKEVDSVIEVVELRNNDIDSVFKEFTQPFDLNHAPLLRSKIVAVSDVLRYVFFDMHHIISDGTSVTIFVKELFNLYFGKNLEELKINYVDFSEWQNKQLNSEILLHQKEYWKQIYQKKVSALKMPTDYERQKNLDFEGEYYGMVLSEKLMQDMTVLMHDSGCTTYMVLMSAYSILLHKYTGQCDIVIGSPIVGRESPDLDNVIGMFVNMIAIRCNIDPQTRYMDYLKQVGENCINAYDNQSYQFEQMVNDLKIERDSSRNPLFDVTLSMQNMKKPNINLGGLDINFGGASNVTKYDIMIFAEEQDSRLQLHLTYRTSLFKRSTMIAFMNNFMSVIQIVVQSRNVLIKDIDLIDEKQKERVINDIKSERDKLELDFEFK